MDENKEYVIDKLEKYNKKLKEDPNFLGYITRNELIKIAYDLDIGYDLTEHIDNLHLKNSFFHHF